MLLPDPSDVERINIQILADRSDVVLLRIRGEEMLVQQSRVVRFMREAKKLEHVWLHLDDDGADDDDGNDFLECNQRHEYCLLAQSILHAAVNARVTVSFDVGKDCAERMFRAPACLDNTVGTALCLPLPQQLLGALVPWPTSVALQQYFSVPLTLDYSFPSTVSGATLAQLFTQRVALGDVATVTFYLCSEDSDDVFRNALCAALVSNRCALEKMVVWMENFAVESGLLSGLASAYRGSSDVVLKHLAVSQLTATAASISSFFDALAANRNRLETLLITDATTFNQVGFDGIARYIASHRCVLRVLDLSQSVEARPSRRVDISALCRAIAGNGTITTLNLSSIRGGNRGALAVCDMLLTNKTLRIVDYAGNPCFYGSDTRIESPFCAVARQNTTLEHFYLCGTLSTYLKALFVGTIANYNYTLLQLSSEWCVSDDDDQCCPDRRDLLEGISMAFEPDLLLRNTLARNRSLVWQQSLHDRLLEFCLALGPLEFPPAVLLEIFDWLPLMVHVQRSAKVLLVERIGVSLQRVLQARAKAVKV